MYDSKTIAPVRATIASLLLVAGPVAADLPDPVFVDYVNARIASGEYVGMMVAVLDAEESYVQSFGTVAKDSTAAPDEKTIFEISSISKTFAATVFAQAVTDGKVDLEDPANGYLEANVQLADYAGRDITMLDLVAHQSGLPYMPVDIPTGEPPNPHAATTRDDLRRSINAFEPTSAPGEGYSYSAFAYGILALILESVLGDDFFALVDNNVTTPLDMEDTVLSLSAGQRERLATGYTQEGEPAVAFDQGVFRAAGSMFSTLHDLTLWLRANMQPETTPMADALRLTHEIHNSIGTIGLAWHKSEGFDDRSQFGTANGYRAYVGFLADGSRGVAILANTRVNAEALGNYLLIGTDLPD